MRESESVLLREMLGGCEWFGGFYSFNVAKGKIHGRVHGNYSGRARTW